MLERKLVKGKKQWEESEDKGQQSKGEVWVEKGRAGETIKRARV